MYPILYLELPGFYVATARKRGANPDALVIHDGRSVVDSDSRGIEPRMTLREAKAIAGSGCQFLPYRPEEYEDAQEAWLTLALDATHAIEPGEQHAAYLDLHGHPDPVAVATSLIDQLCRSGHRVLAGIAGAKWIAKLAAQECDPRAAALGVPPFEPVNDLLSFLAPLPTRLLTPVGDACRERLEFLGYRRIGQIAEAPARALTAQFGSEGAVIRQAAQGLLGDRVVPRFPQDSVSVYQRFEGGRDSMVLIEQAIASLAKQLSDELVKRDLCGCQLIVTVEEEGAARTATVGIGKPTQSQIALHLALCRTVRKLSRSPVWGLRATLPRARRVGVAQTTLQGTRNGLERRVAADVALRMVRQSMGDTSVRIASELPVPRREMLLRVWKHATGWN